MAELSYARVSGEKYDLLIIRHIFEAAETGAKEYEGIVEALRDNYSKAVDAGADEELRNEYIASGKNAGAIRDNFKTLMQAAESLRRQVRASQRQGDKLDRMAKEFRDKK